MNSRFRAALAVCVALLAAPAHADAIRQSKMPFEDKFRQLEVDLPTPNTYRTASGAPGEAYWQQKADYVIRAELDETKRRITASETVTYTNRSPHTLGYLWFQLDQNIYKPDSISRLTETNGSTGARGSAPAGGDRLSYDALRREQSLADTSHGFEIGAVRDGAGAALPYAIVDTMMRIDLPGPLAPGKSQTIRIDWAYNIIDETAVGGRSGYEHFPENDTYIYFIAQWFPRLAAYTDYAGWQHKQFLGRGEFTLEFGDYDVTLTVPADHVVSATGDLLNPAEVLSAEQRRRLAAARTAKTPVFVVSPDEALANEKEGTTARKTWRFKAQNVRDFAFASSRKFIWDAMGVDQPEGPDVMAMSFYPNEAEPLWSKYSTHAVAHTIDVYSKFSFPYPYSVAQSVNTWESGGMEYPMITFNGYRPVKDKKTGKKTYTRNAKYGLIGVVIHEVGHFYFPMIVNSDERQWTWMDEGLNTFLEYMAEISWEEEFPAFGGKANVMDFIADYMTSSNQVPVMTNSESIPQFGPNAYSKPAAALTVLRETVMGREAFDRAFREYSMRWRFKRPTPADFFRTMEDASGVDLDWFWRGWFYSTDHVDLAVSGVREYRISSRNPEVENPLAREAKAAKTPESTTQRRNREEGIKTYLERNPGVSDFYNENDEFVVNNKNLNDHQTFRDELEQWERTALDRAIKENPFVYFVDFENIGGLVSPLPLTFTYEDGTSRTFTIPAEIWRMDNRAVTKMFIEPKRLVSVKLDAGHQLPDANRADNAYPRIVSPSRIELYKSTASKARNQMAEALEELKAKEAPADGAAAPLEPSATAGQAPQ